MKNEKKLLFYLIALLTIFRLIYINLVPLVPQEAYYWKYAKHLALSYFDHPPMAAWTIALFTAIGGDHIFFIRLGSVLFSLGLLVLLYKIVMELFGDAKMALWTLIAINCTVLFSIGATIITPDVPLLFFWALIVYFLVKLMKTADARWWYLSGVGLGFGLISKYTAILIVPGIFLWILSSPNQRRWLKTPHPYLGLIIAILIFAPVIVWNYQHEWASFLFQSSSRFSKMIRFKPEYFFQLIGSQLGMLTPYIFILVVVGWIQIGWLSFKESNEKYSLLFWLALPVYLLFTVSSFRSLVKMNWLAPAYITSIIASIVWINSTPTRWAIRFKKWFKPGLIFGLVIVMIMHLLPIVPLVPIRKGDSWTGWPELSVKAMAMKADMGEDTFIFGHEYKIPSEITFYTANHEATHSGEIIGEKGLQYNYWTNFDKLIGKDAIFITSNAQRYRNIDKIRQYFGRVEPETPLQIIRRNQVFRIFYLYRCYGYKGPNP